MGTASRALYCGLACLLVSEAAAAGTFRVEPIQVFLRASARSALVSVVNESQEPVRFEVTVFAWHQSPRGEMKLEPTNEVVFFPKFFTLDPGKAQKIRVGVVATPVSVEQSYRMFVEELPPVERPTPEAGSRVRVLTKMGIPIFVEPPEKKPAAAVGSPSLGEGTLRFSVENLGNVHFSLFGVRVRGLAADGSVAFERQAEGWYVLAKGRREYEMKLSPEECRQAVKVVVQAETDLGEVRGEATLDPTGCTSSGEGPSSRGGG